MVNGNKRLARQRPICMRRPCDDMPTARTASCPCHQPVCQCRLSVASQANMLENRVRAAIPLSLTKYHSVVSMHPSMARFSRHGNAPELQRSDKHCSAPQLQPPSPRLLQVQAQMGQCQLQLQTLPPPQSWQRSPCKMREARLNMQSPC